MLRLRWLPVIGLLIGIGLMGAAPPAQGAFEFGIKIVVNGVEKFVNNNSADDADPADDRIFFFGTVNDVKFTLGFGSVANSPGTPHLAFLQIAGAFIENTALTARDITLLAAAADYTTGLDDGPLPLALAGAIRADEKTTMTYTAYVDTGNDAVNGAGTDLDFPFGSPTASVSDSDDGTASGSFYDYDLDAKLENAFDPSSAYSMAGRLDFTLSGGKKVVSGSGTSFVLVPVPASLLLAFSGVPVLGIGGLYCRRRQARRKS